MDVPEWNRFASLEVAGVSLERSQHVVAEVVDCRCDAIVRVAGPAKGLLVHDLDTPVDVAGPRLRSARCCRVRGSRLPSSSKRAQTSRNGAKQGLTRPSASRKRDVVGRGLLGDASVNHSERRRWHRLTKSSAVLTIGSVVRRAERHHNCPSAQATSRPCNREGGGRRISLISLMAMEFSVDSRNRHRHDRPTIRLLRADTGRRCVESLIDHPDHAIYTGIVWAINEP